MSALGIVTLAIAVVALLLSLFNTGWKVHRDRLDKASISVAVSNALDGGGAPQIPMQFKCITATNVGRRTAIITQFYFVDGSDQTYFAVARPGTRGFELSDRLPKKVDEGEIARVFIPTDEVPGGAIKTACAIDTHGRVWKSPEDT
jgi:hypothetical protein